MFKSGAKNVRLRAKLKSQIRVIRILIDQLDYIVTIDFEAVGAVIVPSKWIIWVCVFIMVSTNSQKRAPYQQNKLFDGSEKFVPTFIYQTLFRKINARLVRMIKILLYWLIHSHRSQLTYFLFLKKKAIFKNQIIHNYIIIVMFHRQILNYPLTWWWSIQAYSSSSSWRLGWYSLQFWLHHRLLLVPRIPSLQVSI